MNDTILLRSGQSARVYRPSPDEARRVLDYLDLVAAETDYLSFAPGEHGYDEARERAYLASFEDEDRGLLLAAEVDGELAAMASLGRVAKPRLRHAGLFGISVRRAYWNHGLGTALTKRCLDEAARVGMWRIELRVRLDNPRARRVYEKLGFVVEGQLRAETMVDGVPKDSLLMARVTPPP